MPLSQDYANIAPQITDLNVTYNVGERAPQFGRNQIKDRGDRRWETAHDELAVEQNRGDLGAFKQIA